MNCFPTVPTVALENQIELVSQVIALLLPSATSCERGHGHQLLFQSLVAQLAEFISVFLIPPRTVSLPLASNSSLPSRFGLHGLSEGHLHSDDCANKIPQAEDLKHQRSILSWFWRTSLKLDFTGETKVSLGLSPLWNLSWRISSLLLSLLWSCLPHSHLCSGFTWPPLCVQPPSFSL